MNSFITHTDQIIIQEFLLEVKRRGNTGVSVSIDVHYYTNSEEPDITYVVWIGSLKKNYRFNNLQELMQCRDMIIRISEGQRLEDALDCRLLDE